MSIACQSRETVSINSCLTLDFHVGWQPQSALHTSRKLEVWIKKSKVSYHWDKGTLGVLRTPRHLPAAISVVHLPSNSLIHTDFTTKSLNFVFVYIIHSSYMFRPYNLATFRELEVWRSCTAYMETCHTQSADYIHIYNAIRIQGIYHYISRQYMNW